MILKPFSHSAIVIAIYLSQLNSSLGFSVVVTFALTLNTIQPIRCNKKSQSQSQRVNSPLPVSGISVRHAQVITELSYTINRAVYIRRQVLKNKRKTGSIRSKTVLLISKSSNVERILINFLIQWLTMLSWSVFLWSFEQKQNMPIVEFLLLFKKDEKPVNTF